MVSLFWILQWKKDCKGLTDFWHRKMTLKIRIALCLTSKIKKNQRPIEVCYKHQVGTEANLIYPWTQLSSAKKWGHTTIFIWYRLCNRRFRFTFTPVHTVHAVAILCVVKSWGSKLPHKRSHTFGYCPWL